MSRTLITPESLLEFAQKSLARTADLRDVAQIVRSVARRATPADGASFILREDNECHYYDEDAIGPLWKGSRFPLNACISGWAMKHGESVVVPNIYQDPRIPLAAYGRTFVKALAIVPIGSEIPHAAIGVYWATHHRATEVEMERLQRLAAVADSPVRLCHPALTKTG